MTQDKPVPKLCKDCKYSRVKQNESHGRNLCLHPLIAGIDPAGLADSNEEYEYGASCREEREKIAWFAKCGRKGKLFEPKINPTTRDIGGGKLSDKATTSTIYVYNKLEQEIIQMRWFQNYPDEKSKLQYRTIKNYLEIGLHPPIWTEWEDVPFVFANKVMAGVGGGGGGEPKEWGQGGTFG